MFHKKTSDLFNNFIKQYEELRSDRRILQVYKDTKHPTRFRSVEASANYKKKELDNLNACIASHGTTIEYRKRDLERMAKELSKRVVPNVWIMYSEMFQESYDSYKSIGCPSEGKWLVAFYRGYYKIIPFCKIAGVPFDQTDIADIDNRIYVQECYKHMWGRPQGGEYTVDPSDWRD